MDLGLYNLKYPARKLLAWMLPAFRRTDPNAISGWMLPVGAAIAAAYHLAPGRPWLYLLATGLIFVRMFLGTLDGLVAVHFGKATARGELVNRLAPEVCDVLYLGALGYAHPALGLGALAVTWMVTFAGLLGCTLGQPARSTGPAGQTDRLAVLQALSLAAYVGHRRAWPVDFMEVFLVWVILGGTLTVALRLWGTFRDAGP